MEDETERETTDVETVPGSRIKRAGLTVLIAAAAGAALALVVREGMSRHQRDLFSESWVRRLAALGFMAREEPSVNNITLLRDFVAWEPTRLLRERAHAIVQRMEDNVQRVGETS
jgi:hypothetical protein